VAQRFEQGARQRGLARPQRPFEGQHIARAQQGKAPGKGLRCGQIGQGND
jgi:hypothetical protein